MVYSCGAVLIEPPLELSVTELAAPIAALELKMAPESSCTLLPLARGVACSREPLAE